MNPLDLREETPGLQDVAYLNFGAHGPSPKRVVDAVAATVADHEYGVVTTDPYEFAFETYEAVRERITSFIGAPTDGVALTESTTDGITRIASAIDWSPGDVVVRTDLEHPAGILPWQNLKRSGVEVRIIETDRGRVDRDAFTDAVADASLVCFSALTWTHGTMLPVSDLTEIANDAGAFTLVDAVQVPGHRHFDVSSWGADAVAAAGHKWTLGPWGSGFLFIDPAVASTLTPTAVGYRSVEEPSATSIKLKAGARRFEVGTTSPAPHVGLTTAIDAIEEIGIGRIESRIDRLTDRLKAEIPDTKLLSPRSFHSGLVTIAVDDPDATVERLTNEGILVRTLPYPNAIRVSVHAVSTESEIDALVTALSDTS